VPFNLSFTHIAVVGIVALVVLGPERLPEVAKTVGQFYREYKRIRGDLQVEVREAINEFKEPFRDQIDEFKGIVRDVKNDVSSPTVPAGPRPVPAAERRPSAPIAVPPLAGVAPSSAFVSRGPAQRTELPELGPSPRPETFVPYTPPRSVGPVDGN
jgi:sec-independent protein translocase protein TatB